MPAAPRPNKKAAKVAYAILKTPKELQQSSQTKPSKRMLRQWFVDSLNAQ